MKIQSLWDISINRDPTPRAVFPSLPGKFVIEKITFKWNYIFPKWLFSSFLEIPGVFKVRIKHQRKFFLQCGNWFRLVLKNYLLSMLFSLWWQRIFLKWSIVRESSLVLVLNTASFIIWICHWYDSVSTDESSKLLNGIKCNMKNSWNTNLSLTRGNWISFLKKIY